MPRLTSSYDSFRRRAGWVGFLVLLSLTIPASANTFHSESGHYTVDLPPGWVPIPTKEFDAAFCRVINDEEVKPVVCVTVEPHDIGVRPPATVGLPIGFGNEATIEFRTSESDEPRSGSELEVRQLVSSFRFDPGYEYRHPPLIFSAIGLAAVTGTVVWIARRGGRPAKR